MTSSNNKIIKQAVMAGMGIMLISRHPVGLELGLGLLRIFDVEGFPLMQPWFVARRASVTRLCPAFRVLMTARQRGDRGVEAAVSPRVLAAELGRPVLLLSSPAHR
jgi:DNA-binding transcriptional LysR family regulator